MFTKRGNVGGILNILRAHTVTFNEAGAADKAATGTDSAQGYSDHRAVLMRLQY